MRRGRGPGRTISNPISDDFQRASLGANWTVHLGNAAIVASADWGPSAFSGVHVSSWTGTTITGDQFSEAVLASGIHAQMQAQVYTRRRSADVARYAFHYNFEAGTPQWEIKYDGVATPDVRLLATNTTEPAHAAGGMHRIEVRGTGASINIRGYVNGRLIIEANDTHADRITSGTPGLTCREAVGAGLSYPQPVFAKYAAGTLL